MKNMINKYLRKFGAEVHGAGYMQKLRSAALGKSEWSVQQELFKNKAEVVFDVGANRGNTVSSYLDIFPNCSIHSFEPFPDSYNIFHEKHKDKRNVRLNKYALSSKKGKSILNINRSVDTNSLLQSKAIGASSDKSCITVDALEIETDTIDNYCLINAIELIDILKIDVQGSEIEVLKGAVRMLEERRIKVIYSEVYFQQQYVDQPLFQDILSFIYKYNFVLQDIYDPYYASNCLLWGDAIFINKKHFQ